MTGTPGSTAVRPLKRCWNCRARKKSCDRAQPSCGTCLRKDEECLGYGLQLSWPSAANSRRAATSCRTHLLDGDYSNVDFINTLSNDIARFYGVKVAKEAFANVILRHSPYLWSQQPAVAKGLELVSMSAETFAPFLVSNDC
ncbi:hypothetical protein ACCO45_007583 [Purpureocillium lilacinum]|uniref:Uncharacterized protein n=1 Tax=Purpureocillium lilacinum TaxID=33203 RepID=A0ACC4DNT8_PURLI